ncbi:MAG: hypothetical protein ACRDO2_02330 [Nocardioidaceae bacterium]
MARRVYLHVGTMKSGTTYLQTLFDDNKKMLAERNLLWQRTGNNHKAVLAFGGAPRMAGRSRRPWQDFKQLVSDHHGDALISSEFLGPFRAPKAERFVAALGSPEVHVIITARDLTRIVPSHWQETTQNKGTTTWQDWVARVCRGPEERAPDFRFWAHQDLPTIVRHWSQVVPEGPVYLVTVPKDRDDPELIWRRFASVLGVPPEAARPPRSGNPALGAVSAELMRRVNCEVADLDFEKYSRGFKFALAKHTLVSLAADEPRPVLAPEEYSRLREIALTMVKSLAESGVTVVGSLDDLVPDDGPPGPPFDPAVASDRDLLAAAIGGLVGLAKKTGEQAAELERVRRQNAQLKKKLASRPPAGAPPGGDPAGGVTVRLRKALRSLQRH